MPMLFWKYLSAVGTWYCFMHDQIKNVQQFFVGCFHRFIFAQVETTWNFSHVLNLKISIFGVTIHPTIFHPRWYRMKWHRVKCLRVKWLRVKCRRDDGVKCQRVKCHRMKCRREEMSIRMKCLGVKCRRMKCHLGRSVL